jgi:hypothetical protein
LERQNVYDYDELGDVIRCRNQIVEAESFSPPKAGMPPPTQKVGSEAADAKSRHIGSPTFDLHFAELERPQHIYAIALDFWPNSSLRRVLDSPVRNLSKSARPARFSQQGPEKLVGNGILGEPLVFLRVCQPRNP